MYSIICNNQHSEMTQQRCKTHRIEQPFSMVVSFWNHLKWLIHYMCPHFWYNSEVYHYLSMQFIMKTTKFIFYFFSVKIYTYDSLIETLPGTLPIVLMLYTISLYTYSHAWYNVPSGEKQHHKMNSKSCAPSSEPFSYACVRYFFLSTSFDIKHTRTPCCSSVGWSHRCYSS